MTIYHICNIIIINVTSIIYTYICRERDAVWSRGIGLEHGRKTG